MKKTRNRYAPEVKLRAVLRLLQGEVSAVELGKEIGCHPTVIGEWRDRLLKNAHRIFAADTTEEEIEKKTAQLERMIGKLTVQNEFLKKVSETLGFR